MLTRGQVRMTRNENMEHVEVLRDLSEACRAAIKAGDWKVDGACDPDSLLRHADAAIESLSAPQPPVEAQPVAWTNERNLSRVASGDPVANMFSYRCRGAPIPLYAHPAPSAPVGVEWAVIVEGLRLADQFFDGDDNHWQWDDGEAFPASKVRTAYQAALTHQPTAVDEAMVERMAQTVATELYGDPPPPGSNSLTRAMQLPGIRRALTAALAGQQGGEK